MFLISGFATTRSFALPLGIPWPFVALPHPGSYITDLTTLVKLESLFNGSTVPQTGCLASPVGTSQTLYSLPNGSTGNSSFRVVSPGIPVQLGHDYSDGDRCGMLPTGI